MYNGHTCVMTRCHLEEAYACSISKRDIQASQREFTILHSSRPCISRLFIIVAQTSRREKHYCAFDTRARMNEYPLAVPRCKIYEHHPHTDSYMYTYSLCIRIRKDVETRLPAKDPYFAIYTRRFLCATKSSCTYS